MVGVTLRVLVPVAVIVFVREGEGVMDRVKEAEGVTLFEKEAEGVTLLVMLDVGVLLLLKLGVGVVLPVLLGVKEMEGVVDRVIDGVFEVEAVAVAVGTMQVKLVSSAGWHLLVA